VGVVAAVQSLLVDGQKREALMIAILAEPAYP
jgi:hypothetical protein